MTTTSGSVDTTTRRAERRARPGRPATPWTPRGRIAGAACLVAGTLGWTIASFIGFGLDGVAQLEFDRMHPVAAGIGLSCDLIGTVFVLGAAVVWLLLGRERSPKIAWTGAVMLGFALIAQGAVSGVEITKYALARDGRFDLSALADAIASPSQMGIPGYVFLPMFMIGAFLGLVLAMIAVWRSGSVARPAIILVVLFQVSQALPMPVPTTPLLLVGAIWMALNLTVLRRPRTIATV